MTDSIRVPLGDPASIPFGEPCPICGPKGHARHEDDSYGGCVTCREYIPHTDEETKQVPFPCPASLLDAATARALAAEERLTYIFTAYEKTNLVHDVAYEDFAERVAWVRYEISREEAAARAANRTASGDEG